MKRCPRLGIEPKATHHGAGRTSERGGGRKASPDVTGDLCVLPACDVGVDFSAHLQSTSRRAVFPVPCRSCPFAVISTTGGTGRNRSVRVFRRGGDLAAAACASAASRGAASSAAKPAAVTTTPERTEAAAPLLAHPLEELRPPPGVIVTAR